MGNNHRNCIVETTTKQLFILLIFILVFINCDLVILLQGRILSVAFLGRWILCIFKFIVFGENPSYYIYT